jgi:arginine-tRNA-protein transferase
LQRKKKKSAEPVLTTIRSNTEFKPAYYAKVPVPQLSPLELDTLFANGYYRNGKDAHASSIRLMNRDWVSTVMLRVRLSDFVWKKRLRKLLRTNSGLFSHSIRPFVPDEATEALWQRFKTGVHNWPSVPRLDHHLLRGQPAANFHTHQLSVFDGEKLVGFSTFDRGVASITSMEAAYDADYRKHSLGLYTMLLEIAWCQAQGMTYYYPGFFPKDDPMFSYKLRPGNLEFFRVATAEWLPMEALSDTDWVLEEVTEQHIALSRALNEKNLPNWAVFNHCLHWPEGLPSITSSALQHAVSAPVGLGRQLLLFIHWDLYRKCFQVFEPWNLHPPMKRDTRGRYLPHHFYEVEPHNYFGSLQTPLEVADLVGEIRSRVGMY